MLQQMIILEHEIDLIFVDLIIFRILYREYTALKIGWLRWLITSEIFLVLWLMPDEVSKFFNVQNHNA
jgi:hypothetical protein